jgi:hypothetical protein
MGHSALAQLPAFDRALNCGTGAATRNDYAQASAVDAGGNVYVAGTFTGSISFGSTTLTTAAASPGTTNTDIYVAKLSATGTWLWALRAGGTGPDYASSVALDSSGNAYLTGAFYTAATFGPNHLTSRGMHDIFVAKASPAGSWQWASSAGGGMGESGNALAVDADGNTYLTGHFRSLIINFGSGLLIGAGGNDLFVGKLNNDGEWLWAVKGGGTGDESGTGIAIDPSGNAYVAGSFASPTALFGSTSLTNSDSGSSSPAADVVVAKLDADGSWQWVVPAGGGGYDQPGSIALDDRNNSYLIGSFDSGSATFGSSTLLPSSPYSNMFAAKLDADGTWLWAVTNTGAANVRGTDLAVDARGTATLIGSLSTAAAGFGSTTLSGGSNTAMFLARLDTDGDWQWALAAGGSNEQSAQSIALDPHGNPHIAGYYVGLSADFGSYHLASTASSAGRTGFIVRLSGRPLATHDAPALAAFTLSPNPAHGAVRLSGLAPGQRVQVLDAVGRAVVTQVLPVDGILPLSVPAGLYVVHSGRQTRRLVVE